MNLGCKSKYWGNICWFNALGLGQITQDMYSFPRTSITNNHELRGFKQQKLLLLIVLEVRSTKSSRALAPLGALRENPFFVFSRFCYL